MKILTKRTNNTVSHKILDILLLFRDQRDPVSIDAISQRLDIPKSTIYRYVRILCDKGFLEKNGAAHYRLGLTFLELSRAALNSNRDLRLTALPSMKRIAEQVGESVSLMRLFNRQIICIESIEGRYPLRVTIEQGRTQPPHAGASSKLLLACVPDKNWSDHLELPLKRYTETTITDPAKLKEELHLIRQRGYSISDGEIDIGARAIAVPLRNGHNEVVAALSIEGPMSRMDDDALSRYLEVLQHEADIIQQELS